MAVGSGSVTPGRGYAKTRPIQHGENDNTEVLENAAQKVHARFSKIQGPKNMPYGSGATGKTPSQDGSGFNNNPVTAPHPGT